MKIHIIYSNSNNEYFRKVLLQIICHVDASYLTHPDSKSHSGWTISFGLYGSFLNKSKKQQLIATSAMHAEARALIALIAQLKIIIGILIELKQNIKLPSIIFEDNFPLIYTTSEPYARTKRCKQFMMLINYIKEQIQLKFITLKKVESLENNADFLTKLIHNNKYFNKQINYIMGTEKEII
jgi:hypothetical protein